jgi:hypothetical protein
MCRGPAELQPLAFGSDSAACISWLHMVKSEKFAQRPCSVRRRAAIRPCGLTDVAFLGDQRFEPC